MIITDGSGGGSAPAPSGGTPGGPQGSSGGSSSQLFAKQTEAIEAGRAVLAKGGSVGEAYSVGISTYKGAGGTSSPEPSSDVPSGERLFSVSGAEGVSYVYAPICASEGDIQNLAGVTGFVKSVMSPAAYGSDQLYKTVTTPQGQQAQIPWYPEREAKREFFQLQGYWPYASRLNETASNLLTNIRQSMIAGTYVSPMATPSSYTQNLMSTYGMTLSQAQMEERNIYNTVAREMGTPACGGGPWNLQKGETLGAISYLESRGRFDEADSIRNFYISGTGYLDRRISRAVDVDVLPEEYYKNGTYDFLGAAADKKINDATLASIGLDKASRAQLMAAASVMGVLQSGGYCSGGQCSLGDAIAAGAVAEPQVRQSNLFSSAAVDEAVDYAAMFPNGIGAEVGTPSQPNANLVFNPLGGLWFKGPGYEWEVQVPKGYFSPIGGKVAYFGTKQEALDYISKQGWGVNRGVGTTLIGLGRDIWSIAQTPEFTLATAGIGQGLASSPYALTSLSRLMPTGLANWLTGPSRVSQLFQGMRGGQQAITAGSLTRLSLFGGEAALRALTIPTIASTGAAVFAGLSYKPESPAVVGVQNFQQYQESPQYSQDYQTYLSDAGAEYDRVAAGLGPNESMPMSREVYLESTAEDFGPQAQQWFVEQAGKGMEYQPGVIGALGRGSVVAQMPIQDLQLLPGPNWLKAIPTGAYSVYNPLSITGQLYPEHGAKALTTLIPYFGPVTASTAMQWKQLPWYGKALGVGFSVMPFASPLIKLGGVKLGDLISRKQWEWRESHMTPQEMMAWRGVYKPWKSNIPLPEFKSLPTALRPSGPPVGTYGYYPDTLGGIRSLYKAQRMYPLEALRVFGEGAGTVGSTQYFSSPTQLKVGEWTWGEGGKAQSVPIPGSGMLYYHPEAPGWGFGRGGGGRGPSPLTALPQISTYTPTITMPSIATMTQAGIISQLRALGIPYSIPSPSPQPLTVPYPGISPAPLVSPVVSPVVAPVISPALYPWVSPLTSPAPSLVTYPQPVPAPAFTPYPVVTMPTPTVTPVPPEPGITPFPLVPFPFFGGILGGGRGSGGKKKGLLGVGKWTVRGFPVGGTHPITGKPVGYTFMGGKEIPYGIGRGIPKVRKTRKKKSSSEGLVRMYV